MSALIVDCWCETIVMDEASGNMPVVGDECRLCPNVFESGEVVGHPTSTSPDGHTHRGEWVCWDHVQPIPGRRWVALNPSHAEEG